MHESFVRDAAPSLDTVKQLWRSLEIAAERTGGPVALTRVNGDRRAARDSDSSHLELAAHLLVEQGCAQRVEDMIEEGIVRVLPGAARHHRSESGQGRLSEDAREILKSLEGASERSFGIRSWAAEMDWSSTRRLERALIDLSHGEAIELTAWQVSPLWQRVPGSTPDFAAIGESLEQRRRTVRSLSDLAKLYRDNRHDCRRRVLLEYLGAAAASSCHACDVCRGDLNDRGNRS